MNVRGNCLWMLGIVVFLCLFPSVFAAQELSDAVFTFAYWINFVTIAIVLTLLFVFLPKFGDDNPQFFSGKDLPLFLVIGMFSVVLPLEAEGLLITKAWITWLLFPNGWSAGISGKPLVNIVSITIGLWAAAAVALGIQYPNEKLQRGVYWGIIGLLALSLAYSAAFVGETPRNPQLFVWEHPSVIEGTKHLLGDRTIPDLGSRGVYKVGENEFPGALRITSKVNVAGRGQVTVTPILRTFIIFIIFSALIQLFPRLQKLTWAWRIIAFVLAVLVSSTTVVFAGTLFSFAYYLIILAGTLFACRGILVLSVPGDSRKGAAFTNGWILAYGTIGMAIFVAVDMAAAILLKLFPSLVAQVGSNPPFVKEIEPFIQRTLQRILLGGLYVGGFIWVATYLLRSFPAAIRIWKDSNLSAKRAFFAALTRGAAFFSIFFPPAHWIWALPTISLITKFISEGIRREIRSPRDLMKQLEGVRKARNDLINATRNPKMPKQAVPTEEQEPETSLEPEQKRPS